MNRLRTLVSGMAVVVLFTAPAHAQSISGDLVVRVVDPSDLGVPGATVLLTEIDTSVTHSAVTGAEGAYLFSQLKPGLYKLEVTSAGFQSTTVHDVRIQVAQRARVEVRLPLTVTEAVTVSAATATLLNAESAAIGQVMDSRTIVELPLNGRNFIQVAQLSAGAT
ncbi:MAG TPA: carboxypeptidase-like regulatory domain-containing protein, partial [Vicinamibacterales bacterium]|nr:carboxypeptidase-like regulatory domain-containing protein [Vicinamibacterales bacterium]